MAVYSVSRISRLVDMYHGLHAALDKEEANDEGQAKEESDTSGKRFSCPTCKRKNWQSIETFRTHKRACRWYKLHWVMKSHDMTSKMSDFNVKCQMLNVGCQMLSVKCFGLMSSHDLISPSRAPVKKAVLQHCVDCGLNFEGLDELRDHLKVTLILLIIYSNEPPHEGGGRRTKPCVSPSLWCRFFHTGFGHKEDDTFKRRPQKILQDLLV